MKIVFITLILLSSYLNADDVQRIEAIIKDIAKLRVEYEICESELKEKKTAIFSAETSSCQKYKELYEEEKNNNMILKAQSDYDKDLLKSNQNMAKIIKKLEKQIKDQRKLLLSKDIEIKKLRKNSKNECKNTNVFPKLMIKEKYKKQSSKDIEKEEIITFKARPFRLKADSDIYDSINGNKISKWQEGTSFTSNQETSEWVKITGYFVNKKWKKAEQDMWIKKAQVIKR